MPADHRFSSPEATRLHEVLAARVLGQDSQLDPIIDAWARWKAGLSGIDKPVATFLALGPTGVGKTLTVETLAELLHGDARMLIKIHCAEYRHSHEIARLIGAPPGYIGHKETQPRLSQRRLQEVQTKACPLVILLFDEIEKAHPDLWDLLLGVLDKGELSLGDGGSADLRQSLIFLTSNVGAREQSRAIGFKQVGQQKAESAARALFSPEFRNRLTDTLIYRPLLHEELVEVAKLEVAKSCTRLMQTRAIELRVHQDLVDLVLANDTREDFGARPLRRSVEGLIELPLAHLILSGKITAGDAVEVKVEDGTPKFFRVRPGKEVAA